MINISLDSCSIINLINCNQLENILNIPNHKFYISNSVLKELYEVESQKTLLERYLSSELISIYEYEVEIDIYQRLFSEYDLGDGEIEALAICIMGGNSFKMCCDDKKARLMSSKEIGSDNVIGSLTLLKRCVDASIIKCSDAFVSYIEMIAHGGFLPKNIRNHFFCKS